MSKINLTKKNSTFLGLGFLAGAVGGLLTLPKVLGEEPGALPTLNGKPGTALVTGASSGLGAVFARRLAAEGYDLVLIARREERLAELAESLQAQHGIKAEVFTADLSDPDQVAQVEQHIREIETLTLLINNAGFGAMKEFTEIDLDQQIDMIMVNVIAGVRLAYAALPGMKARDRGAIVNVSSVAAYTPIKKNVTYGATKSFVTTFSEALQAELQDTAIKVQSLTPGLTRTEFQDVAGMEDDDQEQIPEMLWMSAEEVVDQSLEALKRGQVVCVPGWHNQATVASFKTPGLRQLMLGLFNRQV